MNFSKKKILITGGAGFIGSALAHKLSEENVHLVIYDDFSTGRNENLPSQCEVIKGAITDYTPLESVKNVDYILHFGAPSSVILFNINPEKCVSDTIIGLRNTFEYAVKTGVKKVIFPSSSSVYGNTPLPQSETTLTQPTNLYGVAKLTCEHLSALYTDVVPSVALRIFAGYGPGEAPKGKIASIVNLFFESIAEEQRPIIFGDGTQTRDFVYIDDIVHVVLSAIETNFTGAVNVGSGESHTFKEVAEIINHLLGKDIKPEFVPKPIRYFEHTRADTTLMKKTFAITPTSFINGLSKFLALRSDLKN
ncbi:MAG: NAD-dependent epimerase/dehydratase family protein [Candidatus Bathyarchaeia archaeon]|jgi:UDP-glucose 4-epimerase